MATLIGERITRFWRGQRFVFERVDADKWVCVHRDSEIIPAQIIKDIEEIT